MAEETLGGDGRRTAGVSPRAQRFQYCAAFAAIDVQQRTEHCPRGPRGDLGIRHDDRRQRAVVEARHADLARIERGARHIGQTGVFRGVAQIAVVRTETDSALRTAHREFRPSRSDAACASPSSTTMPNWRSLRRRHADRMANERSRASISASPSSPSSDTSAATATNCARSGTSSIARDIGRERKRLAAAVEQRVEQRGASLLRATETIANRVLERSRV